MIDGHRPSCEMDLITEIDTAALKEDIKQSLRKFSTLLPEKKTTFFEE